MLNPSTADADSDDPTIRRCTDFAGRWGMAELRVVNLFALRTHDPRQLLSPANSLDPIGPENDRVISEELETADLIVEAWGNHGTFGDRASEVRSLVSAHVSKAWHLGLNMTGEPRHPLYVRSDAVLSPVHL